MDKSFLSLPIRRPILTTVIYFIVLVIGLFSLWRLPIDLMPEITYPVVSVITGYSNAGPQEVEELISRPLESTIAGVQGIEEITSTSTEGRSVIRAAFTWGTNLDETMNDIRDRIDRTLSRLPDEAERPMIRKFDLSAFPIIILGVSSELDPIEVRQLIEDQVQYRLERIDGVASVDIRGGLNREIHVALRAKALEALNISPSMIVSVLSSENKNVPAGSVEQGNKEIIVRTVAEFTNLDDIRNTIITQRNDVPVTVGDVADVEEGLEDITRLVRINGKPGIQLSVSKQSGANTVKVAKGVHQEIAKINNDFPQIEILPRLDTSKFIIQSVSAMRNALLLGGLISIFILLVFLRNFSSTLIIAVTIPISIIATFSLILFGGLTLNLMTFGGLALGIGMLLDSAVVVLDNIFFHREKGGEKKQSALQGAKEVISAVFASTLTTIVVFFPVVFMRGMSGIMFRQLAIVVGFSLTCSLIAALTLVPMLTSKFLSIPKHTSNKGSWFSHFFNRSELLYRTLEKKYGSFLQWALQHRKTVVVCSLLLFIGSIFMIQLIGVELMPKTDQGEVRVSVEMEVGTRLGLLDSTVAQIEQIVTRDVPEVEYMQVSIGGGGWRSRGGHTASMRIALAPKGKRTRSSEQVANDLRKKLSGIPGTRLRVREGGGLFILRLGTSDRQSVDIEIRGYDLETAQGLAQQISRKVETIKGITDTRVSREAGMPEYKLRINRKKAADLGLSAAQIGDAVQTVMGGKSATSLRRSGKEYAIRVRLAEQERKQVNQLMHISLLNKSGNTIPLQSVANIQAASGPVRIERRDRERIINVEANYSGRDLGSVVSDIRQKIQEVSIPSEFAVIIRGDYEEQQKAFRELMISLILAIVLVYLVMAGQFESFKDPFVVLFSIPMALIGVVIMLYLTNTPFSIQAYIGCIVLTGVVVNNAIVLIDYINRLRREQGLELFAAITTGGIRRLRPIMITALTTAMGLFPLSLAIGEGSESQAPMARVVIGGLLASTFITLILIPVIYSIVEQLFARRMGKSTIPGSSPEKSKTTIMTMLGFILIFGSGFYFHSSADTVSGLSLQDALNRAVRNNPLIRIDRIDVAIAETLVKENCSAFYPSLAISGSHLSVSGGDENESPLYNGEFSISEFLPIGTLLKYSASSTASNRLDGSYTSAITLLLSQSLLKNGWLKTNLVPLKKASLDLSLRQEEMAGYAQQLLASVENTYWDLYLGNKEATIHALSLDLAERLLYESEERVRAGRIAPLDIAVVKAEIATRKLNVIKVKAFIKEKQYTLEYLLNDSTLSIDSTIVLTDTLPKNVSLPDISAHQAAAMKFRPDLRQALYLLAKSELDLVTTRNGLLPKLDFFVTLSGTAYGESFGDAITNGSDATYTITTGLSLGYPLPNQKAKSRHTRAVYSKQQQALAIANLRNLVSLDIRLAKIAIEKAYQQIEAAKSARILHEIQVKAEQEKLAAGKSTEYLVLQSQRDLTAVQLNEVRAETQLVQAMINLFLKDGTLLERRGIDSGTLD